ncbi:FG-GAP-like repeat-containing protein [Hanstruepera ponticola]|uniref:FG-GAP-like repeat-containing protein n=1 Tax=Hanstruepera ponticola TaxID=2042995 RepID=UPI0017813739|nr:FG-GAP-like repeat-containing protein [Hanstruepera ponticola]
MNRVYYILISSLFIAQTFGQVSFSDQANALGLNLTCGTTYLGNGVTFYDFDNDGWDDITLNTEFGEEIRFFKNINGVFTEIFPNIPYFDYQTKQVNWVDIDNDGDKDLFVTSDYEGNRLFENIGDLNFQDITVAAGIDPENMFSYGASWGDYNNDGYLDVFISNRTALHNNILYSNDGDGTFTDVSLEAGISTSGHGSFCSAFLDINNDGYQDIYISNDRPLNPNILYKNNGDGTFTDISISSGTDVTIDAMTVTVGDFNNDSWFDIYITNGPIGNVLFKNNGNETFTDVAVSSGTVFNSVSWGASFFDADNDMDQDLYVCGEFDATETNFLKAAFYLNNDDETFTLNNESFPGDERAAYSSAVGDSDNDGYPELIVTNSFDQDLFFWKNNTPHTNNWLKLKLEGTVSNRDGIGSTIEISINGEKQYAYTHCGEGYLSQNSGTKLFGLGTNTVVDYVKVTWLSGTVDVLTNVSANQQIDLVEGSNPELSVEESSLDNFVIYPNPVGNKLFIRTTMTDYDINIYDVVGKLYLSYSDFKSNQIDVSLLDSGMYFIQFINGNQKITKKFSKR